MTAWNLEGHIVSGKYMGSIPVTGLVTLSRVAYGGRIDHHLDLLTPVDVYGTERETVILENEYVERVSSS